MAKDKPQTARIVAIGDFEDGKVKEGDLVVFARYSGTGIALDGLLGIVEEQQRLTRDRVSS